MSSRDKAKLHCYCTYSMWLHIVSHWLDLSVYSVDAVSLMQKILLCFPVFVLHVHYLYQHSHILHLTHNCIYTSWHCSHVFLVSLLLLLWFWFDFILFPRHHDFCTFSGQCYQDSPGSVMLFSLLGLCRYTADLSKAAMWVLLLCVFLLSASLACQDPGFSINHSARVSTCYYSESSEISWALSPSVVSVPLLFPCANWQMFPWPPGPAQFQPVPAPVACGWHWSLSI